MYGFADFIRSCGTYTQFAEYAPVVRERRLVDPFTACLLTLMLDNKNTERLFSSDNVLFQSLLGVLRITSNPYVGTLIEQQVRSCTREQAFALYYSLIMVDYPRQEMTELMRGSDVTFPRVFLFLEDESLADQFPTSWLTRNEAVIAPVPLSHNDRYFSVFRQSLQTSNSYYYKSKESVVDIISPFVRVVTAEEMTPEEFMLFVEKTVSDDVCGIIASDASFPLRGWYYSLNAPCADITLAAEAEGSTIVALNDPRITFAEYQRYAPEASAETVGEGDSVLVFASNWKVVVEARGVAVDEEKLRRFFSGRVLPTEKSSYGFFVFECLVEEGKVSGLRPGLFVDTAWARYCLPDVLPAVRIFPLAYSPSNKPLEQFFALTADERVMNYIGEGGAWTTEKTFALITQAQQDTITDSGNYFHWILVDNEDNLLCYIGLSYRARAEFHEVRIISRVPRRGYARRAVVFASNHFRANFRRNVLKARVNARNEASVRLFDSLYPSWEREKNASGVIHYKLK